MELYQLRSFVAIAQEGNLTRAAERVFTSAPAVSAQLKALEDELGVRLFERSARGMPLTAPGRRLLDEAERTLASATRLRSAAEQIRGAAQGVVRLGTVTDPVTLRLGDVLVDLAERYPQVSLQLRHGLSSQTLAALRAGELDCAYMLADDEAVAGMALQRLGPIDLVVALPPALAESAAGMSVEQITQLPWIGTPPSCLLRVHLERLFASVGREFRAPQSADNDIATRAMVASGLGAGLLRADQAEQAQRHGELRIWPGWRSRTWLCWVAPEGDRAPAVDAVRSAVTAAWS